MVRLIGIYKVVVGNTHKTQGYTFERLRILRDLLNDKNTSRRGKIKKRSQMAVTTWGPNNVRSPAFFFLQTLAATREADFGHTPQKPLEI